MNKIRLAILTLLIALMTNSMTVAQPLCYRDNSVEWLMLDIPVIVHAKLVAIESVENHPKVSELRLEVLESFRGDVKGELRVPIETLRESGWANKLATSTTELIFYLVKKPRGYIDLFVAKLVQERGSKAPLYYFGHVNLDEPERVYTLEMEALKTKAEILKRFRSMAREKVAEPPPAPYTFQRHNCDFLSVPLNERMEEVATQWRKSSDKSKRNYGEIVEWGFKKHRNKAFESGYWYARLKCPGGYIRFGLRLDYDHENRPYALIINGSEAIRINDVSIKDDRLQIDFLHYDSVITAEIDRQENKLNGKWRKLVGKDKWGELEFSASMKSDRADTNLSELADLYLTWGAKFSKTEDRAIIEIDSSYKRGFRHKDVRQYRGTVLTTTGDYRYLAGDYADGKLELSAFDGAHAFLFRIELVEQGKLKGDFWSRDNWHETWTATRENRKDLPDAFKQTRWNENAKLGDLKFPNLERTPVSLTDEQFAGKVRIITIFGTWCPNCHDSAIYLKELHAKYAKKGLSIVGLAFEITGDFDRDAKQVRRYIERHDTPYPILLAGVSDKEKASKTLPILDRVRSYPTTIFLNSKNEVINIHTGFSGPATHDKYLNLRRKFEAIIEKQLSL
jgi:thiol-disulfide isomerase/thioredoxin